MREFFHGWKDKLGSVTLLLACLSAGGWVRSSLWVDGLEIRLNALTVVSLRSCTGGIEAFRFYHPDVEELEARGFTDTIRFTSWQIPAQHNSRWKGILWRWNTWGFRLGSRYGDDSLERLSVAVVPYWAIVIPLTVLSAWLLLSKRGQPGTGQKPFLSSIPSDARFDSHQYA